MSGGIVSNTVKLEFPPGSPRPSWDEIAGFIKKLDTDLMSMETVYKMGTDRSLCIKYESEAAMQEALRKNQEAIKFDYSSGKTVELHMLPAGIVFHYVRVFDVPPEVADEVLCSVLGKYGRIQRSVREKFPVELGIGHLFNGVRGLFMEIDREIPPALDIGIWKAKVFYDGLKEKCFLCQLEGHRRNTCPEAKKLKKRNQQRNTGSEPGNTYAGVVEAGAAVLPRASEDIVGEVIEILEEETTESEEQPEEAEKIAPITKTTEIEIEFDEEQLREIDEAAEKLGLQDFRENIAKMAELIDQLPSPNSSKDQASQRRAQFAATSSTDSIGLRPKKSARKSNT